MRTRGIGWYENGQSYESRNLILRKMGFRSYAEYLKSDLWKRVRASMFKRKDRLCYICSDPAYTGHHNRYRESDLNGETIKHLHPICEKCHDRIELEPDGSKRPMCNVTREFLIERRNSKQKANGPDIGDLSSMFDYLKKPQ